MLFKTIFNKKVLFPFIIIVTLCGTGTFFFMKSKTPRIRKSSFSSSSQYRRQDSIQFESEKNISKSTVTYTSQLQKQPFIKGPVREVKSIPETLAHTGKTSSVGGLDPPVADTLKTIDEINRLNKQNR